MGHISQDTNGVHCTYLPSQNKIQKCALISPFMQQVFIESIKQMQ